MRIGVVTRAHGLRGAVIVRADDPASVTEQTVREIYLRQGASVSPYAVQQATPQGRGKVRLALDGVDSREKADALRDAIVLVAESDLPPPAANEFYAYRAIGCSVVTVEGRLLGAVTEVFATGANDVLVVQDGTGEILVPVTAEVIKRLDFAAGRITIAPVPGLLD